jgi:hypothetical protein
MYSKVSVASSAAPRRRAPHLLFTERGEESGVGRRVPAAPNPVHLRFDRVELPGEHRYAPTCP